jgi:hypothetical protein
MQSNARVAFCLYCLTAKIGTQGERPLLARSGHSNANRKGRKMMPRGPKGEKQPVDVIGAAVIFGAVQPIPNVPAEIAQQFFDGHNPL